MFDFNAIARQVAVALSDKRFQHTERVVDWADQLACYHRVDRKAVKLAAYLHDVAKQLTFDQMIDLLTNSGQPIDPLFYQMPQIVHAWAGAVVARDQFGVIDPLVCDAIRYHTTGRVGMSAVEAIVYIADATESGRAHPQLSAQRALAKQSLNAALLAISSDTIRYLIGAQKMVHPNTVALYNSLLICKGE